MSKADFKGEELLGKYIVKQKAEGLGEKTVKVEYHYLKTALRYIDKDPRKITLDDIDQWKYEMLMNRKYETETVYRSILTLRKFLRYMEKDELVKKIKLPRRPKNIPPEKEIWLLPDEQKAMIDKSKELGIREHAIIRLFLSSGVRSGELINIDIPDIDFDEQIILIRRGKGGKSRIVCFDKETKAALLEYLKIRKPPNDGSQALFISKKRQRLQYPGIKKIVKTCALYAGIRKKITPHKLRHTFVTTVIETTKDIPLAQKLAGHADIHTTMRYHHSTHGEVVAKYKKYFDSPGAKQLTRDTLSGEEILRALDTKYINGDMPYDLYVKLRKEYEERVPKEERAHKPKEYEVAYQ